jgi:hypothetical protein
MGKYIISFWTYLGLNSVASTIADSSRTYYTSCGTLCLSPNRESQSPLTRFAAAKFQLSPIGE